MALFYPRTYFLFITFFYPQTKFLSPGGGEYENVRFFENAQIEANISMIKKIHQRVYLIWKLPSLIESDRDSPYLLISTYFFISNSIFDLSLELVTDLGRTRLKVAYKLLSFIG